MSHQVVRLYVTLVWYQSKVYRSTVATKGGEACIPGMTKICVCNICNHMYSICLENELLKIDSNLCSRFYTYITFICRYIPPEPTKHKDLRNYKIVWENFNILFSFSYHFTWRVAYPKESPTSEWESSNFPRDSMIVWGRLPSRKLTYPPKNGILKMIFLFPRWDMLVPWRVSNV